MPRGVYKRTPGTPRTPEHCAAIAKGMENSAAVKAYAEARKDIPLSPEHCDAMSAATLGVPKTPEHCEAMSKAHKESEADKANADRMRGGNDIIDHHYIYDHNDLSKNTIQMTRSDHTRLHWLLRKLGYVVPHINLPDGPVKEARDEVL